MNCIREEIFQSTLLQEERHSNSAMFAIWYIFQSTLLQEERPWSGRVHQSHFLFQSTLLQEERLCRETAPSMEVIYFNPRSYKRSDVSQQIDTSTPYDFNPRSYKRSDSHTIYFPYKIYYFNPRSYKRSDVVRAKEHNVCSEFQSTLLQEERPADLIPFLLILIISIHAPTRGATQFAPFFPLYIVFQSTLLQEERRCLSFYIAARYRISIHAPTRGATAKMHNNPYTYL